jgi:hypothetical protein
VARSERRFINYPTNQLLGVLDSPEESDGAMAELMARGVPAEDVLQLSGPEGAARLDGIGTSSGLLPRLLRAVQFMTMDQMPDFLLYETAIRAGRTVLAVRVRGAERRALVIDVLTRHGAHFLNLYARFATEEISRWRGPEPRLPGVLRR